MSTIAQQPTVTRHAPGGPRLYRPLLVAAALMAVAATLGAGLSARDWIGRPFPGFFVLANRVVPSVGLPRWAGSRDGSIYQRAVVAVDGEPVAGNAQVYARVAERPAGTMFTYALRRGATTDMLALASDRFSTEDYWTVFGAYLASGVLYLALGLLAAWLHPRAHLGRALLCAGGAGGIYALSAVGFYDAGGAMRVHALAEAFFPAALVYLALVFPRERGRMLLPLGAMAWWLSLALAVPYQLLLGQPGAYSMLHATCETYLAVAGLALIATLLVARARAAERSDTVLRGATAGALLGLGVPAVVMMISGVTGGGLPVNVSAWTAFLFPLCFGWGLLRERTGARRRALAPSVA